MGFSKKYVPEYHLLVKELLTIKPIDAVTKYTGADALIGPTDSMELLNDFIKNYYEGDKDSTQRFIETLKTSNR